MKKFFLIILPALLSVLLFGATVFLYVIPRMESAIMAKKREMTRELVTTVIELLASYEKQVEQGLLERRAAEQRALARVRNLRYGPEKKDYFWISDLRPHILMHPYRPDLENKDASAIKDVTGKVILVEAALKASQPGGGYIDYYWQWKDQPDKIAAKISYVGLFEPWGWVVGSGIYYDDVTGEIAGMTRRLTLTVFAALFLVAAIAAYLSWKSLNAERKRKSTLAALRLSEEKFRGISASAHDGIVMMGPDGLVSYWNPAAAKIFGYTREEAMGKELHRLIAPADVNPHYQKGLAHFGKHGDGKVVGRTLELVALRKDQTRIPVALSVSAFKTGDKWHAVGVVRDISEQKKSARALQESETKYRTLFEAGNDAILLINDGLIVDSNELALEMFDLPRKNLMGKTLTDLSPEFQEGGVPTAIAAQDRSTRALEGEPQQFEWLFQRVDAKQIHANICLKQIHLFSRDHLLCICRDITAQKQMAAAQERAASLMTTAIEQSPAGILIADTRSKRLLHANAAALSMLGISEADYHISDFQKWPRNCRILGEDGAPIALRDNPLKKATQDGVVTASTRHIIEKKSGERNWIEVNAAPVRDELGEIIYGVAVFTDITRRIKSEEEKDKLQKQLQQAQKMEAIGTLAGGIAHDFNNILFILLGNAELAQMRYASGEDITTPLSEVRMAGMRARDLVQQILDFSRQTEKKKQPVVMAAIVQEALKLLRASMPATIDIRTDISPERARVYGDPTNIYQLIMNLCANAEHAMHAGGGVLRVALGELPRDEERPPLLKTMKPGPLMRLKISDTGTGIPRELQDKIFDPFFTTKKTGEGTGIGLSLVHSIVKDMGGAIHVESEPGDGSTFTVYLPRLDTGKAVSPDLDLSNIPRGSGHVLLVDDEIGITQICKKMITKLGYRVTAVNDALEALDAFETGADQFDVVITDLTMPKMTGIELTRRIKSIRSGIPVVLWTGYDGDLKTTHFETYGFDQLLMKPPTIQALGEVLHQAIHTPQPPMARNAL